MEFAVKKCNSTSSLARLAAMTLKVCSEGQNGITANQTFETPFCFQYTNCGTIPHISWELGSLIKDDNSPLLVPLSTTLIMRNAIQALGGGLSKFAKLPKNRSFLVTINDPLKAVKGGYNTQFGISVWTSGGRREINLQNYLDIVSIFNAKMFESLCDSDTPVDASVKRVTRAVNRTLSYLEQSLPISDRIVFASIEGGYNRNKRLEAAEETAKLSVDAFSINGFHLNGENTEKDFDLKAVKPILTESLKLLPADKPRAMFGAFNPTTVLELINCGVDIFDSSYATLLTDKGVALTFNNGINISNLNFETINLNNAEYKEDFKVISDNCDCYTCREKFTKAYINHLLNAKEMLAYVLLNMHNVHTTVFRYNYLLKYKTEKAIIVNVKTPKILIWTNWWESRNYWGDEDRIEVNCLDNKIILYQNRFKANLSEMDAVVFHDLYEWDIPQKKYAKQKWILFHLESPVHSNQSEWMLLTSKSDWTMTYRIDSDIVMPYGACSERSKIRRITGNEFKAEIPNTFPPQYIYGRSNLEEMRNPPKLKPKQIAWFVSNCETDSKREQLAKELSQFIQIDIYGACGKFQCSRDKSSSCLKEAATKYNFYLSFENSLCKDYMTEKVFGPMFFGLLPIVFGGGDYSKSLPPNSFIDAMSFRNMKDLASYLHRVSSNESLYSSYFEWNKKYAIIEATHGKYCSIHGHFCPIGDAVVENRATRKNGDVIKWFFDSEKCFQWIN